MFTTKLVYKGLIKKICILGIHILLLLGISKERLSCWYSYAKLLILLMILLLSLTRRCSLMKALWKTFWDSQKNKYDGVYFYLQCQIWTFNLTIENTYYTCFMRFKLFIDSVFKILKQKPRNISLEDPISFDVIIAKHYSHIHLKLLSLQLWYNIMECNM